MLTDTITAIALAFRQYGIGLSAICRYHFAETKTAFRRNAGAFSAKGRRCKCRIATTGQRHEK
jgi:hypothetical protein